MKSNGLQDVSLADFLASGPANIQQLNKRLHIPVSEEYAKAGDRVIFAEESVVIEGDYGMYMSETLLVDGDLTITGGFFTTMGYDPDSVQQVVINGNLNMCRAFIGVDVFVVGDVTIDEPLLAHSWGDYTLSVAGDLNVPLIIDGGHHFKVKGKHQAQRINGYNVEQLQGFNLPVELLNEGKLDFDKAIEWLEAGKLLVA